MERVLQVISGNSGIAIPYWDWTIDQGLAGGPRSSTVWTNALFGPGGVSTNGYAVPSGPFCSTRSSTCAGLWPVVINGPTLDRELGRWASTLPSANSIRSINTTISIYDSGTYDDRANGAQSFRTALEGFSGQFGGAHNLVHVFVGGSMSPLSSPNDPVFFFHHCNIDRIWYLWQRSRGCYSGCYRPLATDPSVTQSTPGSQFVNGQWRIVGHHWNDNMPPWGVSPSRVADSTNSLIGYNYA